MKKFAEFLYFNIAYALVYLLFATYRVKQVYEGNRALCQAHHSRGAYILVCWHEYFVPILVAQRAHPFCPIVSRSSSGRLIGYIMKRLGFLPIFGSQNRNGAEKGGKEARVELAESLAKGRPSAFTVDGSIGPRRVVKPGAIDLAKKSQAAILPVSAAMDRYWELNTWDRLKIPKPFARIAVSYGEPLLIPPQTTEFAGYQEAAANAINLQEDLARAFLATWS